MKRRRIRGLPSGTSEVFFESDVHRVYCPRCRSQKLEELHFLSHAKSRMTRSLERTVLELRKHMSIRAVCGCFHLRWHMVRELEKEALRSIYANSKSSCPARIAFHRWCAMAKQSGVPAIKQMGSTLRDKLDGIVSFWTFHHLTNASMEGFNNKIRWLIRQAYGFRDMEYFKLKIFQLPEVSCVKDL